MAPPVVTAPSILVCKIVQLDPTVAWVPPALSVTQIIVSPASTFTPEAPPILPATEIFQVSPVTPEG